MSIKDELCPGLEVLNFNEDPIETDDRYENDLSLKYKSDVKVRDISAEMPGVFTECMTVMQVDDTSSNDFLDCLKILIGCSKKC